MKNARVFRAFSFCGKKMKFFRNFEGFLRSLTIVLMKTRKQMKGDETDVLYGFR